MIHEGRVQTGDVWRDNDPRNVGREVMVTSFDGARYANCVASQSQRRTRISVRRLLTGAKFTLLSRIALAGQSNGKEPPQ